MKGSTEIGVLKPLWSRRPDGRWGIHDLKGIRLKPKAGHDADFFAFDSKMEMLTARPPTNQGDMFASFGPTDFIMKQSIVPVMAWVPGAPSMRCIGTGFLVSCTGYVITASHVVLDPRDSGYGKVVGRSGNVEALDGVALGALMPVSPAKALNTFEFRPFIESCYWGKWQQSPLFHLPDTLVSDTDVAVCKLQERQDGSAYQPLNLSLNPFTVGETAYAIGYALMEDIPVSYVDGRPSVGKFDWELYVSVGEVAEVFPRNDAEKQVRTPGPCFSFRARIPGKMSGSPIFGGKGAIIRGVVSSSYSGEKNATGCMIGPIMSFPLLNGQSLGSLLRDGKEGMSVMNGRGL